MRQRNTNDETLPGEHAQGVPTDARLRFGRCSPTNARRRKPACRTTVSWEGLHTVAGLSQWFALRVSYIVLTCMTAMPAIPGTAISPVAAKIATRASPHLSDGKFAAAGWIRSFALQCLYLQDATAGPLSHGEPASAVSASHHDCFSSFTMVRVPLTFSTRTLTLSPS